MTPRHRLVALRRAPVALALVVVGVVGPAAPAAAHGIGGRTDLPLPLWMFAYGASAVLIISFVGLVAFWPRPRWERGVKGIRIVLSDAVRRAVLAVGRLIGLSMLLLLIAAAFFGGELTADNPAPVFVFVVFWVGFILVCGLIGNLWYLVNPFAALAWLGERLGVLNESAASEETTPESEANKYGHWPAVVLLFGWVWYELVYPDRADPRHLGVAMVVYTAVAVSIAVRWGAWALWQAEAFSAFFGLLAHMAPIHHDEAGRLRLRPPLVGLAQMKPINGTEALVIVALGSTTFDGLTRTQIWTDLTGNLTGWSLAAAATVGLVWAVGVVALLYVVAVRIAASMTERDSWELAAAFVHSLVPIAFGYAVAHYFSLLVFEGQAALILASDPFDLDWDLFGTADWFINFTLLSTTVIAWVQAGAIVAGHVAGVVLAHDRALAILPGKQATRSQYPLLVAMVIFTVGGLALLLGG